jgi:hypothetical protein
MVLYRSLAAVCDDFLLRVFCMDRNVERLLSSLALPHVEVIPLEALEAHDPELAAVKPSRSLGEYCWTATPAICLYALENESDLEIVTYLDADLMFHHRPDPLFEELGGDSILITPHRYAARWSGWEARGGTYNVQFVTFRRDVNGLAALRWWRERCIEWCYDRIEDGKFGDQQYLDDWPRRFQSVHVLQHPGGGVGPWNSARYRIRRRNGNLLVDDDPLIFFHYESVQLYHRLLMLRRLALRGRTWGAIDAPVPMLWAQAAAYETSADERALLWEPYARQLSDAICELRRHDPEFVGGFADVGVAQLIARAARRALPLPRPGFS